MLLIVKTSWVKIVLLGIKIGLSDDEEALVGAANAEMVVTSADLVDGDEQIKFFFQFKRILKPFLYKTTLLCVPEFLKVANW